MTVETRNKDKINRRKTILVPIDFSTSSTRALRHGLSIAGDSSRVLLLHVVEPVVNSDADLLQFIESARQKLEQFCKSDGIVAPEPIRLNVRSGTPFREILECAKEQDVEMIVLGLDETSSSLGGITLGHTADRVSRYARCPVLLVREGDTDVATPTRAPVSKKIRRR